MVKVHFTDAHGSTLVVDVELSLLADNGILLFRGRHYVFAYFIHGGDGAVQFVEATVAEVVL